MRQCRILQPWMPAICFSKLNGKPQFLHAVLRNASESRNYKQEKELFRVPLKIALSQTCLWLFMRQCRILQPWMPAICFSKLNGKPQFLHAVLRNASESRNYKQEKELFRVPLKIALSQT